MNATDELREMLKAAGTHKYIKRLPHPNPRPGRKYIYFYNQEQIRKYRDTGEVPGEEKKEEKSTNKRGLLSGIMSFFGAKTEKHAALRAKELYVSNKINVSLETFTDHLNEYLTNKEKWDAKLKKTPAAKKEPGLKKNNPKAERTGPKKTNWNLALMRKIAGIVDGIKDSENEVDKEIKKIQKPEIDKKIENILNKYALSIVNFNPQTKQKGEFLQFSKEVDQNDFSFIKNNRDEIISAIKELKSYEDKKNQVKQNLKKQVAESKKVSGIKIKSHSSDGISLSFDNVENYTLRDDYNELVHELKNNWEFYEDKIQNKSSSVENDYGDYSSWTNYKILYNDLKNIIDKSREQVDVYKKNEEKKKNNKKLYDKIRDDVFQTKMKDISYGDNPDGDYIPVKTLKNFDIDNVVSDLKNLKEKDIKAYNQIINEIKKDDPNQGAKIEEFIQQKKNAEQSPTEDLKEKNSGKKDGTKKEESNEPKTLDKKDYPESIKILVSNKDKNFKDDPRDSLLREIPKKNIKGGFEIFGEKFVIARDQYGSWSAFSVKNGKRVSNGAKTIKEAISGSVERLKNVGPDKLKQAIKEPMPDLDMEGTKYESEENKLEKKSSENSKNTSEQKNNKEDRIKINELKEDNQKRYDTLKQNISTAEDEISKSFGYETIDKDGNLYDEETGKKVSIQDAIEDYYSIEYSVRHVDILKNGWEKKIDYKASAHLDSEDIDEIKNEIKKYKQLLQDRKSFKTIKEKLMGPKLFKARIFLKDGRIHMQKLEDLYKAKRAEIGEERTRTNGKTYKKVAEGKWVPVANGKPEGKTHEEPQKKKGETSNEAKKGAFKNALKKIGEVLGDLYSGEWASNKSKESVDQAGADVKKISDEMKGNKKVKGDLFGKS